MTHSEIITRVWWQRLRAKRIRDEAERRLAGCGLERVIAQSTKYRPERAVNTERLLRWRGVA